MGPARERTETVKGIKIFAEEEKKIEKGGLEKPTSTHGGSCQRKEEEKVSFPERTARSGLRRQARAESSNDEKCAKERRGRKNSFERGGSISRYGVGYIRWRGGKEGRRKGRKMPRHSLVQREGFVQEEEGERISSPRQSGGLRERSRKRQNLGKKTKYRSENLFSPSDSKSACKKPGGGGPPTKGKSKENGTVWRGMGSSLMYRPIPFEKGYPWRMRTTFLKEGGGGGSPLLVTRGAWRETRVEKGGAVLKKNGRLVGTESRRKEGVSDPFW